MDLITEKELSSVDIELPIAANNCADVADFESAFAAASRSESHDELDRRVYGLFSALCGFHFKPEDKVEPFSNKWAMDGKRSLMGSDLDKPQIDEIARAFPNLRNAPLRARIADLIWTRDKKRSEFARTAIESYCDLAGGMLQGQYSERFERAPETGITIEKILRRAAIIAAATGWDKPENDRLRALILEVLRKSKNSENKIDIVRFGRLANDYRIDGHEAILSDVDKIATDLADAKDFHQAESVLEFAISIARRLPDADLARTRTLALVNILERKADASDGAFLKTHALQQAIDALSGLKNVRDLRQRLHEKLTASQLHMYEEFGQFEHTVDLTDEVERIKKHIETLDFFGLVEALALTSMPKSSAVLMQEARVQSSKAPLTSLFQTSIVDSKGRTVGKVSGSFDNESEERTRYQVIQTESIRIGLSVAASIDPIRQFISDTFVTDLDVLIRICEISPFVPEGMEVTFARGLRAFIAGDDPTAVAFLVPNLEAGIRAMVTVAGRTNTKIESGGIEQLIGLGPMFDKHRDALTQVFGDPLVFCIENLFIYEHGPKIRHSFCHGMTPYNALFSQEYVYSSKLIYALVLIPLILAPEWEEIKRYVIETTSLRHRIEDSSPVTE